MDANGLRPKVELERRWVIFIRSLGCGRQTRYNELGIESGVVAQLTWPRYVYPDHLHLDDGAHGEFLRCRKYRFET